MLAGGVGKSYDHAAMPSGTGQRARGARDRDWIDVIAIRRSSTDAHTAGEEIYTAVLPPSTGRSAPCTKLARSVARNTIASAISSGAAGRPAGACAASCCSASPIASVPSVRVGPGLTVLTRTPLGPYSAAHALVSRLIAALLDP